MVASAKSLEIDLQQETCTQQCRALEQEAGIAEAVSLAYDGRYLSIPTNPAEEARYGNQVLDMEKRAIRLHIRDAYFSVADMDLRRKLIAKSRECEALRRRWFQQEVSDAHARLKALNTSIRQWWLLAALCGAGFIGGGYFIFAIPGAIAGALAGLFLGRAIEHADESRREAKLKEAENDLAFAKTNLHEVTDKEPAFSRSEEHSGEPDPTSFR
jgi:hypothetical protein